MKTWIVILALGFVPEIMQSEIGISSPALAGGTSPATANEPTLLARAAYMKAYRQRPEAKAKKRATDTL